MYCSIIRVFSLIPVEDDNLYGSDVLTKESVCPRMDTLAAFLDEVDASDNCSKVFDSVDLNKNGFIGLHETLQYFAESFGVTEYSHWQELKSSTN